MAGSANFHRFVDSFHDGGTTRERYESFDLTALSSLEGAEREAAEVLLLERLAKQEEDPRVPPALVVLRASPAARAGLRQALAAYPNDRTRVAVAEALWQVERHAPAVEVLVEIARTATLPDRRIAASNALRDIPGPEADEALLHVVEHDEDDTSRMAAEIALFEKYRIEGLRRVPGTVSTISSRLRSPDETAREAALRELRTLVENLRAGRSPGDPGPIPTG